MLISHPHEECRSCSIKLCQKSKNKILNRTLKDFVVTKFIWYKYCCDCGSLMLYLLYDKKNAPFIMH